MTIQGQYATVIDVTEAADLIERSEMLSIERLGEILTQQLHDPNSGAVFSLFHGPSVSGAVIIAFAPGSVGLLNLRTDRVSNPDD